MSKELISWSVDGCVGYITLNRPEKLNALTVTMLDELRLAVEVLDTRNDVSVVILHSASERAFCVGADINVWGQCSPLDFWRQWVKRGHVVFDALAALRQPVIAVLNGPAFGGGLELALAADLRIAEDHVQLALPETGIGTIPGWSGSQRLNRFLNPSIIKEMVFTGEKMNAKRAEQFGLVNRVCDKGEGMKVAVQLANTISKRADVAVQLTKQVIDAGCGDRSAVVLEGVASGLIAYTDDAKEGLASFVEKRTPNYKGY